MSDFIFSEGTGVADSVFGKSQAPIRMFIEKKGEAFEQSSMLPHLFYMTASSHWAEKYTTLSAMGNFEPVGENGAYPQAEMREGYARTLENQTWKSSFAISREMTDDSNIVDFRRRPLAFIASYYRTREDFGARLYAAAINGETSFTVGGKTFSAACAETDAQGAGKPLFGEHKNLVTETVQINRFTDPFSADALSKIETAMQNTTGDSDEVLDIAPDTIVIPNDGALKKKVFEVIGADKDPATANNGFNYQFGRWNVVISPYLNKYIDPSAATAPWILLDSKYMRDFGGAVFQDRIRLEVRSTLDEQNDANIWKGYSRFAAGFSDWRFAAVGGAAS